MNTYLGFGGPVGLKNMMSAKKSYCFRKKIIHNNK